MLIKKKLKNHFVTYCEDLGGVLVQYQSRWWLRGRNNFWPPGRRASWCVGTRSTLFSPARAVSWWVWLAAKEHGLFSAPTRRQSTWQISRTDNERSRSLPPEKSSCTCAIEVTKKGPSDCVRASFQQKQASAESERKRQRSLNESRRKGKKNATLSANIITALSLIIIEFQNNTRRI